MTILTIYLIIAFVWLIGFFIAWMNEESPWTARMTLSFLIWPFIVMMLLMVAFMMRKYIWDDARRDWGW
jgi:hypothetical protein